MNRPEWVYILLGCIACFCTGGFQPAVGVIISKIIAVSTEDVVFFCQKIVFTSE